jgi:hypothetical protein
MKGRAKLPLSRIRRTALSQKIASAGPFAQKPAPATMAG